MSNKFKAEHIAIIAIIITTLTLAAFARYGIPYVWPFQEITLELVQKEPLEVYSRLLIYILSILLGITLGLIIALPNSLKHEILHPHRNPRKD